MRIYHIIIAILISSASFSQSVQDSSKIFAAIDTVKKDGAIFTKAEKMPKIIGGVKALEDNLSNNLSNQKPQTKLKNLHYKLTVAKDGSVRECELVSRSKNKTFTGQLESVLKQTSGMWEPAVQNGHKVTAVKVIEVDYENGNFNVKELN